MPKLICGSDNRLRFDDNYPDLKDQRDRIRKHADNVVMVVALIFAAGTATGIVSGTGMLDGMKRATIAIIPAALRPYMAPITAVLSTTARRSRAPDPPATGSD